MSNENKTICRRPPEGRTVGIVGDVYRFLATGDETGGSYSTFEATVPPGGGPPPHLHRREDESFLVMEGEITFHMGDESFVAGPGTFVHMPIGQPHSFKNESDSTARMLITLTPAGLEEMFFQVGTDLRPGASAPPPSQEEIQQLLAVADQFGIEFQLPE